MNKSTRAAMRTARSLMASGLLGQDLQLALSEAHPTLSPDQRSVISKFLRKEVGILGQAAHDPNLYTNCRQAKQAKERHKHPHTLIATYRTPYCGSCKYNRKGNCTLMGGKLIAGAAGVDDGIVNKTASLLVEDGLIPEREAQKIASSSLPARQRTAALHIRRTLPLIDEKSDIRAQQQSRRLGSLLQNHTRVHIEPARMKGPRIAKNMEDREADSALQLQSGDEKVSRRAASFDSVLRPSDMIINLPGDPISPRKDIRLASRSFFDMPKMVPGNRNLSAIQEEHLNHVQEEHGRLTRVAANLLARGEVTTEKASNLVDQLETLRIHGAVASKRASRIARQLNALSGALEL